MTEYEDNSFKKRKHEDIYNDDVSTTTSNDIKSTNSELLREANEALQESNKIHVRPIVDESKLGIDLFVGDRKHQFHGIIKTRYADFIVHEIDYNNQIVELNQLDPPEETGPCTEFNLDDLVDSKAIECITEVNNGYLNQYKIDVTGMDKDTRTELHQAIRTNFDRVESSTVCETEKISKQDEVKLNSINKDDKPDSTQQVEGATEQIIDTTTEPEDQIESIEKKYILITRRNKMSRPKNLWPRDRPDYTHFILYKENKDTSEAIYNLAASVNTRPSNFASAGVKDRRAVTSQWLSSWRLEPKRLVGAVKRYNKHPFIKVGNFCFKKEPLRMGQLNGNKFDIVVRNLIHNSLGEESIDNAMNAIKQNGFINYFGLQRFGTRSIQTHEVGLAILQGKWEKAVDLILSYRFDDNMHPLTVKKDLDKSESHNNNKSGDSNSPATSSIEGRNKSDSSKKQFNDASQHNSFIDLWKSKLDAEIVFKKYPHFRYSNEGTIMKFLSKSEESSRDYMNALISLPRSTRSMYVHSYQSLIWNKAVTYRLRNHGFKVIPGDLILCPSSNITDNSLDLLLSADEVADTTTEESNVKSSDDHKTNQNNNNNNYMRKAPIEEIESKLIIATADDKDNYSIYDVVLPIVGSRIKLPENDVGEEILRLLNDDELELSSFKKNERLFISFGSYRKIMVKPKNVKWSLRQYSHPHQNLVETDIDRLIKEMKLKDVEGCSSSRLPNAPISDSSDEALVVEFELPSSSYATMCLREIMKQPSTEFNSKF